MHLLPHKPTQIFGGNYMRKFNFQARISCSILHNPKIRNETEHLSHRRHQKKRERQQVNVTRKRALERLHRGSQGWGPLLHRHFSLSGYSYIKHFTVCRIAEPDAHERRGPLCSLLGRCWGRNTTEGEGGVQGTRKNPGLTVPLSPLPSPPVVHSLPVPIKMLQCQVQTVYIPKPYFMVNVNFCYTFSIKSLSNSILNFL